MSDEILQAAAVPFREDESGAPSVLLIRRVPDGAWGIPKGLIDPGQTAEQAALMEALEEAGVEGELSSGALGEFQYRKFGGVCRVQVFMLRVTKVHEEYEERQVRQRRWFPIEQAAELVKRPELKPMIRSLAARL